jgi:hypothetical protein
MTTTTIKLSELVFNFEFYPRAKVDSYHVAHLTEAYRSGAELPALIVDKESKNIVDGFHRGYALERLHGKDAIAKVILKSYPDRAAMFLDAMVYNGGHGRNLSTFDRAHCVILAERYGIEPEQIAASLAITIQSVGELRQNRVGRLKGKGGVATPLKRTLRHMVDQPMTEGQVEAQTKLGGMEQLFYVNQIIVLIENDLLDVDNPKLMLGLEHLAELLQQILPKKRKGAA